MFISNILRIKGTAVHTIDPDAMVDEAVQKLVQHNVGSLVVMEMVDGQLGMRGIITERDILRAQAGRRVLLDQLAVRQVMSTNVITTSLGNTLQDAMRLMTAQRIRHLPVTDEGRLLGIVSIGDILKAHHDELEMENHHMKSYIQGEAADVCVPL